MEERAEGGRSLAETPTYAVASVVTFMVAVGFFFHASLRWTAKVRTFLPSYQLSPLHSTSYFTISRNRFRQKKMVHLAFELSP